MDDFLSKPVDLRELEALLSRTFAPDRRVGFSPPSTGAEAHPTNSSSPSLLDRSIVDSVRSVMPPPRFAALLVSFFDSLPTQLHEMRTAAGGYRGDDLRALAHRLKGAALNLGLRVAAATAQELQKGPADTTMQAQLLLVGQLEADLAASRRECEVQGFL